MSHEKSLVIYVKFDVSWIKMHFRRFKNIIANELLCHVDLFHGYNRKGIETSVFYVVRAMPISRQRAAKHISAAANTRTKIGQVPLLCNAL
jgi:hypothetical protein